MSATQQQQQQQQAPPAHPRSTTAAAQPAVAMHANAGSAAIPGPTRSARPSTAMPHAQPSQSQSQSPPPSSSSASASRPARSVCKFFSLPQGCRSGDACQWKHPQTPNKAQQQQQQQQQPQQQQPQQQPSRAYANAARGGATHTTATTAHASGVHQQQQQTMGAPSPSSAASPPTAAVSPSPSASPPAGANGAGSGRGKDYGYDHGKPGKKPATTQQPSAGSSGVAASSAPPRAVPPYAAPLPRVVGSDESQPRINLLPKVKAQGKNKSMPKGDSNTVSSSLLAGDGAAGPSPLPTPSPAPLGSPSPRPAFPDPRPSPAPPSASPALDASNYPYDQLTLRGGKLSDPIVHQAAPAPAPAPTHTSAAADSSSDVPASAIMIAPVPSAVTPSAVTNGVQETEQQLGALSLAPNGPSSTAAPPSHSSPLLPMHSSDAASPSTHSTTSQLHNNGAHSMRAHPQQAQTHMRRQHQHGNKQPMHQQVHQQLPQAHMQSQPWMQNNFHAQPFPQQFPQAQFHQQRQPQFHPAVMFSQPPPFFAHPVQQLQPHHQQQQAHHPGNAGYAPREPRAPRAPYEGGRPRITFTATGKRNELCLFWQQGKCHSMAEPQRCQFLHGENDTSQFVNELPPPTQQQQQNAEEAAQPAPAAAQATDAAPSSPLAPFGGWLAHDRVHHFRDLVILEKSNATAEDLAAATAAAAKANSDAGDSPDAPSTPLQPVKPLPASQYVTTLLVFKPSLSNTSFHSVVRQSDRTVLVRLLRDVCALLEQEHHISDFHFRIQERRAEVLREGETAVVVASAAAAADDDAAATESEGVVSARAHIADPSNFHIKLLFGGHHTPMPVRHTCMSCAPDDPKMNGALLEKRPYNHVWLDAQGRSMIVVTPFSHHERLSALNDDQLYALYADAFELLSAAQQYTAHLSGPASSSHTPFVYDHLIINQGLYRNFAHLHLKCRVPPRVWAMMATHRAVAGETEHPVPFLSARYPNQVAAVEQMKNDGLLKRSGFKKAQTQTLPPEAMPPPEDPTELLQEQQEQQQQQPAHAEPDHRHVQNHQPMHAAWDYPQQQQPYGYAPSPYYPPMQQLHPAQLHMMAMQQQQQQQQGGDLLMQFPRMLFPMPPQHFSPQQLQAAYLQAAAQAQAQAHAQVQAHAQAAHMTESARSHSSTPAAPSNASPMVAGTTAPHSAAAPPLLQMPVAALPATVPTRSAPASPAVVPSSPLLPVPPLGTALAPAAATPPQLSQQQQQMRPSQMWPGGPAMLHPSLPLYGGPQLLGGAPLQFDPFAAAAQQQQQLAMHHAGLSAFPHQLPPFMQQPYPQFAVQTHPAQQQQQQQHPFARAHPLGQMQQFQAPHGAANGPKIGPKKSKRKPKGHRNEPEGSGEHATHANE